MLLALIVACEIGFWIMLLLGLTTRYLLRWQRTSAALLLCVPLIDLVLLAATIIDLRNGAVATFAHGLAAAYIGFTVAFGHSTIRWADQRFAHRFADGPPPWRPPSYGWDYTLYEWRIWLRALAGFAVASVLLLAAIVLVEQPQRTEALRIWIPMLGFSLCLWLLFGPLWYTVFPKKKPEGQGAAQNS